jgi:hypothetical protein
VTNKSLLEEEGSKGESRSNRRPSPILGCDSMDEIEALGSDWVLSVAEDQDVDLHEACQLREREGGQTAGTKEACISR